MRNVNRMAVAAGVPVAAVLVVSVGIGVMRLRRAERDLSRVRGQVDRLVEAQREGERERQVLSDAFDSVQTRQHASANLIERMGARLDGRLEEMAAKGIDGDGLREEVEAIRRRQEEIEAFWAQKGELLPPIPPETLAQGYRLNWAEDPYLPLGVIDGNVPIRPDGGVLLGGGAHLRSVFPASTLSLALQAAESFSIEVVFTPADLTQSGPARIVSISQDHTVRNLTVGQEGNRLVVRLRTTETDPNGSNPMVQSEPGALTIARTHAILVKDGPEHQLYLDGQLAGTMRVPGTLDVWDASYPLLIGNEAGGGRTWEGVVHRVVFFTRVLEADEILKRVALED